MFRFVGSLGRLNHKKDPTRGLWSSWIDQIDHVGIDGFLRISFEDFLRAYEAGLCSATEQAVIHTSRNLHIQKAPFTSGFMKFTFPCSFRVKHSKKGLINDMWMYKDNWRSIFVILTGKKSIPSSRGIATHGSHASGRWLGVPASVLKSPGRCGDVVAYEGWSTFCIISWFPLWYFETLTPFLWSQVCLPLFCWRCRIYPSRYTGGRAPNPKGLHTLPKALAEILHTEMHTVRINHIHHRINQCSHQQWFDWSLCMDMSLMKYIPWAHPI